MRTILPVLLALIVSGDEEIKGHIHDSVLLPCSCTNRNVDMDFLWQMEKPNKTLVFNDNKTSSKFYNTYEGRAKAFLDENRDNCSVLLTNVTAEDQGTYRCIFHREKIYKKLNVQLSVFANYTVCQKDNKSLQVVHCEAQGSYKEAEIQWHFNGELIADSPRTYTTWSAANGLHHFSSTLQTRLNTTSGLKCDIKAKGVTTNVSYLCQGENEPYKKEVQGQKQFWAFLIIPIVLMIGLSVLRWYWKKSQRLSKIREVKTDSML